MHGDHCYGLPGLLASAGMLNRTGRLYVVGPSALKHFLDGIRQTTQLLLQYEITCIDIEDKQAISMLPDFDVHVTALSHRVPSFAYSFIERNIEAKLNVAKLNGDRIPAGPLWGQIQQGRSVALPDGRTIPAADYQLQPRKPRKVIVGGDNDTPNLLAHEAQNADVLIHEATYTEDVLNKVGPAPQHSSAKRVAQFASEARIRNLVLTHFSPRYQAQAKDGLSLNDLEAEARTVYDGNLSLANDFARYALDKAGVLTKAA
jgi:ribonuclease Z